MCSEGLCSFGRLSRVGIKNEQSLEVRNCLYPFTRLTVSTSRLSLAFFRCNPQDERRPELLLSPLDSRGEEEPIVHGWDIPLFKERRGTGYMGIL